ncbi:MAG: SUMF1/EgtB/PvdO family nonheme iron enzyme [Parvularculaceae bacterium]|nr:SUMF1/EgtB/PvdO family nonheme iron enzyme [Parvularculaceae bacterium]
MSKVRLLFAPENTGFADKLASALAQSGYASSTEDDPAAAALVIWSNASASSKPILSAARSALARRVLVPVALGKTPPPPSFEHLWPMDLAGWNGRPDDPRWKFVLDELELATRRGVVFRPAAANDRGAPSLGPEAHAGEPAAPASAPPEDGTPALFAEERVETIRPRPNFPRIAVGAGFAIAALAGAVAAALLIGVSDGRRGAEERDPPVAFVVKPRPASAAAAAPEAAAPEAAAPVAAPMAGADPQTSQPAPLADLREGATPDPASLGAQISDQSQIESEKADGAVATTLTAADSALAAPVEARATVDEIDTDPIAGLAWSVTAPADEETASLGRYLRDCLDCPDLAELDAGTFLMGAAPGEAGAKEFEGPQVPVTLTRRIAMAVRETTFAEWGLCVADGVCAALPDSGFGRGKRPVVNVSLPEAEAYVRWLSNKTGRRYRLPSEAEWEYSARAGAASAFAFGATIDAGRANYDASIVDPAGVPGRRRGVTAPSGSFAPNAYGLFDMNGNVWEWTADCWRASHSGRPTDAAPVSGPCASRVIKGGAWSAPASSTRPAHRDGAVAASRRNDVGFRVVRDLD